MYQLTVDGMRCGGCVRGITKSVQAIDANAQVKVELATKTVRIDSTAALDCITNAIVEAGYLVTESGAA